MSQSPQLEDATFAAGCFWGVEDYFMHLEGVISTEVGYTGGHTSNPTYKEVCYKDTGHAEAVRITFNPLRISYQSLLEHFFHMHNPTTLNRQGPDVGSQYRSAIFYHTENQKQLAESLIQKYNSQHEFGRDIVTEVVRATNFYRAEEYHQKYFIKNGGGSCHVTYS